MSDLTTTYSGIKALEAQLLPGASSVVIDMGTYNASPNGGTSPAALFIGVTSQWVFTPPAGLQQGSWDVSPGTEPNLTFSVVQVQLRFAARFLPASGTFTLTVNGTSYTSPAAYNGQSTLLVDVGRATNVNWDIVAQGRPQYKDSLSIQHVGFGAFTVPALPIGIIYAPPQGAGPTRSSVTYVTSNWVGTRVSASSTQASSTTTTTFMEKSPFLLGLGSAISSIADPVAQTLGAGLTQLASLLQNQETQNQTVASSSATGTDLELVVTQTLSVMPDPTLDQGEGDRILYLSNVRLVWLQVDGNLSLHILGWSQIGVPQAGVKSLWNDLAFLRQNPSQVTGPLLQLDRQSMEGLLALDPFAAWRPSPPAQLNVSVAAPAEHGHTEAALPWQWGNLDDPRFQRRFQKIGAQPVMPGAAVGLIFKWDVVQSEWSVRSEGRWQTTDSGPSLDWFSGQGISTSKTMAITNTSSRARQVGTSLIISMTAAPEANSSYQVYAYKDVIYGGVAFVKTPYRASPVGGPGPDELPHHGAHGGGHPQ